MKTNKTTSTATTKATETKATKADTKAAATVKLTKEERRAAAYAKAKAKRAAMTDEERKERKAMGRQMASKRLSKGWVEIGKEKRARRERGDVLELTGSAKGGKIAVTIRHDAESDSFGLNVTGLAVCGIPCGLSLAAAKALAKRVAMTDIDWDKATESASESVKTTDGKPAVRVFEYVRGGETWRMHFNGDTERAQELTVYTDTDPETYYGTFCQPVFHGGVKALTKSVADMIESNLLCYLIGSRQMERETFGE